MFEYRLPKGPWVPLVWVVLAGVLVFSVLSNKFLTSFNAYVVLSSASLLAVIGFSQLVVLSVGEFSLAVGGIGEFSGIIVGYLLVQHNTALGIAILAGLAVGAACGFLNGILVAKSGVNGFIITLATGGLFAGASLGITETSPFVGLPQIFNTFGTGHTGPFPYIAGATIVVAIVLYVLFRWSRVGRIMLAVGGNREAAELSGLSGARAIVWAHTLSGLLAAVAGVMATAQLHEANPSTGTDWLIVSFTVPIIGGTVLSGGSVSVGAAVVAAVILAIINDGLVLVNVDPYWVTLVEGALVFVAVILGRTGTLQVYRDMVARVVPKWRPASG